MSVIHWTFQIGRMLTQNLTIIVKITKHTSNFHMTYLIKMRRFMGILWPYEVIPNGSTLVY